MKFRPVSGFAFLLLAAITAGCGNQEDSQKVAAQVAAKVNGYEITVHQINNILARSPNVAPEAAGKAKREILNRLIDQHLAQQHAIDLKLDRSPSVMQAVEAARGEILARAYLEQVAAVQPKPTAEEAKKYYAKHPELFANRRIFNLEEIVVMPAEGLASGLRIQVAEAHSLQDIANWLKSRNAEITANRAVRGAEEIPMELLPDLQAMERGEIRLIETLGRLYVLRVVATQEAPVNEVSALPLIQQFLSNKRSAEAVAREMKQLKERANIVYVGEFAKELTTTDGKSAAGAEAPPPAARAVAEHVEKGVRGLK